MCCIPSLVCLKNRTFEYSALYCKWLKCDCSCFTIIHKMECDESFTWWCIGRTCDESLRDTLDLVEQVHIAEQRLVHAK